MFLRRKVPALAACLLAAVLIAAFAISPPSASSSRTRWPLPVPPMAGLQGMLPTASRLIVKTAVRSPMRAQASPASMPAWPAPITATS